MTKQRKAQVRGIGRYLFWLGVVTMAAAIITPSAVRAVSDVPDLVTICFPCLLPKSGTGIIAPEDERINDIKDSYAGLVGGFYARHSHPRTDYTTGDSVHGEYCLTRAYGYVFMPWPLANPVMTAQAFATANGGVTLPPPVGYQAGQEGADFRVPYLILPGELPPAPGGETEVVQENGEMGRHGQRYMYPPPTGLGMEIPAELLDGVWSPGEAFNDRNMNSLYDLGRNDFYIHEDWWETEALPRSEPDALGETYADYSGNTVIQGNRVLTLGYETNVTILLSGIGAATNSRISINELDLDPRDNLILAGTTNFVAPQQPGATNSWNVYTVNPIPDNAGDLVHTHQVDSNLIALASFMGWTVPTNNIPTNSVFDFVSASDALYRPHVYQVGTITYDVWVDPSGNDLDPSGNYANAVLAQRTIPLLQSWELYGGPDTNNNPVFTDANRYTDLATDRSWMTYTALTTWDPATPVPDEGTYIQFNGGAWEALSTNSPSFTHQGGFTNVVTFVHMQERADGVWNGDLSNVFIQDEEFEDFLSWWDPVNGEFTARTDIPTDYRPDRDPSNLVGVVISKAAYDNYITWNYQGDDAGLIAFAGNGKYDGPEDWYEGGSCKYRVDGALALMEVSEPNSGRGLSTWLEEARTGFSGGLWTQWWVDAFGTAAPAWDPSVQILTAVQPIASFATLSYIPYTEPVAYGGGVQTTFSFTLGNPPIANNGSVRIDAGVDVLTDAGGTNGLVGFMGGSGTINYATGDVTINLASAPDAVTIWAYYYMDPSQGNLDTWTPPQGQTWPFDSQREFHDMPSSLYHNRRNVCNVPADTTDYGPNTVHYGGNRRLGEPTSPIHHEIYGFDFGTVPQAAGGPDRMMAPSGPLAYNVHGAYGWDAGNSVAFELLTRRLTATSDTGPFSRDTNLDGIIDQGNSPNLYENYKIDTDGLTADTGDDGDTGAESWYPYNRHRSHEDFIEAWDEGQDWTDYQKQSGAHAGDRIPWYLMWYSMAGSPGSHSGGKTDAWTRDTAAYMVGDLTGGGGTGKGDHVFATGGGMSGEAGVEPATNFLSVPVPSNGGGFVGATVHEQGHDWYGLPDLYDYDIRGAGYGLKNAPMGGIDIMGGGGGHCGDMRKARTEKNRSDYGDQLNDWMQIQYLTNILVYGGGPIIVDLWPAEHFQDQYYRWDRANPPLDGLSDEHIDIVYVYDGYDTSFGEGIHITHNDLGAFDGDDRPEQQRHNGHFTWEVVPADGQWEQHDALPEAATDDTFPGDTAQYTFTQDTDPPARWWDMREMGIRILDIELPGAPGVPAFVTMEWYDPSAEWEPPSVGRDIDGDQMPDAWEYHFFASLGAMTATSDFDNDGLLDRMEYLVQSDPTDRFSLSFTGPYPPPGTPLDGQVDLDGDGMFNEDEQRLEINPLSTDSDDDGYDDADEVDSGTMCYDLWISDATFSRSPLVNRSLELDGTPIAVPAGVSGSANDRFELSAWTIECWVKPTSANGTIIERVTYGGATNFALRLENSSPVASFTTTGGTEYRAGGTLPIPLNEWTHIAGVFDPDGDRLSLYLNGVSLQDQVTIEIPGTGETRIPPTGIRSGVPALFTGDTEIGTGLTGYIDDLRIWSIARTRMDVVDGLNYFGVGIIETEDGGGTMVAYYPFDDGGNSAEDYVHGLRLNYLKNAQYALTGVTFSASEYVDLIGYIDDDDDGLPNWWERVYYPFDNPSPTDDWDEDGLNNLYEFYTLSNPNKDDTDNDGIQDGSEDYDGDGLANGDEQMLGVDPRLPDTDDDGTPDGVEREWATSIDTDPTDSLKPVYDRVLVFGGTTNDYVEFPPELRFELDSWTIEARALAENTWSNGQAVIRYQIGPGVTNIIYGSVLIERRAAYLRDNYVLAIDKFGRPTAGFGDFWVTGDTPLPEDTNTWRSLSASYDHTTGELSLYVDGVLRAQETSYQRPTRTATGPLVQYIGQGFRGRMEEIRIWTGEQTASNIVDRLDRSLDGDEPDLVAYYRCDDGTSYNAPPAGGAPNTYNGIFFPSGDLSFADEVVNYTDGGPVHGFATPTDALAPPDGTFVCLGSNGTVTLRFTNNAIIPSGDAAPDLYIFEVQDSGPTEWETNYVEVSDDGATWYPCGEVIGGVGAVDIDPYVPGAVKGVATPYTYVRLTDAGTNYYGVPPFPRKPGVDIDAVGAVAPVSGSTHGTSDNPKWHHGQVEDAVLAIARDWESSWLRSASIHGNVVYQRKNPGVINVTSPNADGAYYPTDNIDIYVEFSEPVTFGMPVLRLETGTTDQYAFYIGATNATNVLHFRYTIQDEDWNIDLDYLSSTALYDNGVPIRDLEGNVMDLKLPLPGSVGSLGWNKDIFADPPAPFDRWMSANGLSDPNADPDADGVSNAGEYNDGTDPNDPASALVVQSVKPVAEGIKVEWQAVVGTPYLVQYSDDMGQTWESPWAWRWLVATDPVMSIIDDGSRTGGTGTMRFYRVVVDQ